MTLTQGYILVLDPERRHHDDAHSLATNLQYPVFVASSTEQAVTRASQTPPCLVILMGNNFQAWSQPLVNQLRQYSRSPDMTIVALTDSASPQWNYSEDTPGVDGLLVQPLSMEILRSLVESAFARSICQ
ncbi:response regulator [Nodosilinea sp. AN01ver1]|uniref:response regulator n=1 Tax=Nodosilinea sp. AN01ver1 TaxID=3423362 RepID=UPI003D31B3BB